ncbi:MAG: universal stress protein UspA [Flavobacteriaceae bacterium]|nr:MAG: universal stress protein UspA [Flavobacteriaceae bacterium]
MKKILVPVDFSKQAEYAAKVASQIAKKNNHEIFLLHMLDVPVGVVDPASFGSGNNAPTALLFLQRAHEKFEEFKKLPFFDGLKISETVQFHKAYDGIIEESLKRDVDLIVMGSQGASGLEEILVGSNTEKVVRNSKVPVLVIKEDVDNFDIKNVVFASNFNIKNRPSFQNILNFTQEFDATIHLLKINTIQNFESTKASSDAIRNFINGHDLQNYTLNIYNDKSIEAGILNFSKLINADVILLNTHGRKGLAHLFSNRISEDLTNHSKLPVATFKLV